MWRLKSKNWKGTLCDNLDAFPRSSFCWTNWTKISSLRVCLKKTSDCNSRALLLIKAAIKAVCWAFCSDFNLQESFAATLFGSCVESNRRFENYDRLCEINKLIRRSKLNYKIQQSQLGHLKPLKIAQNFQTKFCPSKRFCFFGALINFGSLNKKHAKWRHVSSLKFSGVYTNQSNQNCTDVGYNSWN